MIWWLVAAALAGVPDGVRPVVAPLDAEARYRAWLGRSDGPAASLACEPLWEGASLLCFRVWEGSRRRWVTQADLAAWRTTTSELRAAVQSAAPEHVELERRPIVDMEAHWWLIRSGDGWAAAGVLAPERVAERLGGGALRAAVPAEGVFVVWRAGDREVDHVMAVAVRELFDQAEPVGVSPLVHTWDGVAWTPWARAVPEAAAP